MNLYVYFTFLILSQTRKKLKLTVTSRIWISVVLQLYQVIVKFNLAGTISLWAGMLGYWLKFILLVISWDGVSLIL